MPAPAPTLAVEGAHLHVATPITSYVPAMPVAPTVPQEARYDLYTGTGEPQSELGLSMVAAPGAAVQAI